MIAVKSALSAATVTYFSPEKMEDEFDIATAIDPRTRALPQLDDEDKTKCQDLLRDAYEAERPATQQRYAPPAIAESLTDLFEGFFVFFFSNSKDILMLLFFLRFPKPNHNSHSCRWWDSKI